MVALTYLRKRREFLVVQNQGRRFRGRHLMLMVRPGLATAARAGLTVSKKVGGAVVRNRVKRRLREVVRREQDAFCAGKDHVFISYSSAARADFHALREDVLCLLAKAQRWVLSGGC